MTYWENGLLHQVTMSPTGGGSYTSNRNYAEQNRLSEYDDGFGNTFLYTFYPDNRLDTVTYPRGQRGDVHLRRLRPVVSRKFRTSVQPEQGRGINPGPTIPADPTTGETPIPQPWDPTEPPTARSPSPARATPKPAADPSPSS
jgi:hypothetical protein